MAVMTQTTGMVEILTGGRNKVQTDNSSRPGAYWRWAATVANKLQRIFPRATQHDLESIAATCRFELRGQYANGNDWGRGFLTFIKSYGHTPVGVGAGSNYQVQRRKDWIELNAHQSANIILKCFGITTEDVYRIFGAPVDHERKVIDLYQVVNDRSIMAIATIRENIQAG